MGRLIVVVTFTTNSFTAAASPERERQLTQLPEMDETV
jgi:hypothetical protein